MTNSKTRLLTTELNSTSRRRREKALDQIRAMPHGQAVKTIARLASIRPVARLYPSKQIVFRATAGLFLVLLTLIVAPDGNSLGNLIREAALSLYLVGIGYVAFNLVAKYRSPWVHPLLTEYEDGRLVAPVLKMLRYPYKPSTKMLEASLLQNLPHLTYKLALSMSTAERVALRELTRNHLSSLRLITLEALLRIEDTEAIPLIARLLKHETDPKVRAVAEDCLYKLRAIQDRKAEGNVLLRPSNDTTGETTLLRVAHAVATEEEQQLLRPGSGSERS